MKSSSLLSGKRRNVSQFNPYGSSSTVPGIPGAGFLHMGPFIDFFKVAVYNEKRVDKEDAS